MPGSMSVSRFKGGETSLCVTNELKLLLILTCFTGLVNWAAVIDSYS